MKRYLIILFSCFLCIIGGILKVAAQETFTLKKGIIYIVRHGEKEATGDDPKLSVQGQQRSGDLYRALQNKVDRIYVSQFRRTQQTADSLRIRKHIDTIQYIADNTGDGLVAALQRNKDKHQRILIVAHSNTIPVILRRLGIADFPAGNLPENEYDNLYTVTYHKGKAFLFKSRYDKSSLPAGSVSKMKKL